MEYRIIDGLSDGNRVLWRSFIENHPTAIVFQTPEFADLFDDEKKHGRIFIGILDDSEKLLGMVFGIVFHEYPRFRKRISSRTVIYGGPLLNPGIADPLEVLGKLLDTLICKVKKSSLFIEFRNFEDCSAFETVFRSRGFHYQEHLNLFINTSSREKTESVISKSKLRQVRKSLDAGAVITEASSSQEIEEFYDLLKDLYKNKIKKPIPDIEIFQKFFNATTIDKLGTILLVKYQNHIVAGMVCPVTPGRAIHEWYVCGNDRLYREIFPSVLITWAAIEYAVKNNLSRFDFMGIGKPGKEYGVRHFKSRFGGEVVNYGRFIRVNNKFNYFMARIGFNILGFFKKA